MAALILVLNAGSSTLKASLIQPGTDEPVAATTATWAADRAQTVREMLERLTAGHEIAAVAHRVVHGGPRLVLLEPTVIDWVVELEIDSFSDITPLHNAIAVEVIRAAREALPMVPHVACFDTSFHSSLPEVAWRYAVPYEWWHDMGVRRYGFHGLSVEWSVRKSAELLGLHIGAVNAVVAHLGSGCSVTAVNGGRSIWTSMGFTPLEGLMMGTRSGSIDPGLLLHLLRMEYLTVEELGEALTQRSGLLGVSGLSNDMAELRAAAVAGNERATLAIDMFVAQAAETIAGAFTWTKGDVLVFTGGIGENDSATRDEIVSRLPIQPQVLVIEAREDLVMARAAAKVLERTQKN